MGFPFPIAEDGNHHIQRVKTGLEGDALIEIKGTGDDVNHDPHEPLFQIFAGQGPDADDAEGRGEGVSNRNPGVGEGNQEIIYHPPENQSQQQPQQGGTLGEMTDGEVFLFLLVQGPGDETIDGHGQVIKFHATIGIQTFLII